LIESEANSSDVYQEKNISEKKKEILNETEKYFTYFALFLDSYDFQAKKSRNFFHVVHLYCEISGLRFSGMLLGVY
jgi:hypothetical protein